MTGTKLSAKQQYWRDELSDHLTGLVDMHLTDEQFDEAVELVAIHLSDLSTNLENTTEQAQRSRLARLMDDPFGQLFSTLLTDRVPRLLLDAHVSHQALTVLNYTGIPESFKALERFQLLGLKLFGRWAPSLIGGAIRAQIKREAHTFLMRGETDGLSEDLAELRKDGVRVNINELGEEVLGAEEAQRHMDAYLRLLKTEGVNTISVKVSSICAQLSTLAFDHSLTRICESLRVLYRAARGQDGAHNRMVMLDMEAYRDLELTLQAFMTVLSEPEFKDLSAGIVLQAYLPDSHDAHERLLTWALERHRSGGAPIQLRLVKGANLAVERFESSVAGWAVPVYPEKSLVDASFKTLVAATLQPEVLSAVRLGIASHNLFDVSFALCISAQRNITEHVHYEVLVGMGGGLSRALVSIGQSVLVYSPAVADENLHAAVAYLVRRLDENTADENFLRHSFAMHAGDVAWRAQYGAYQRSRRQMHALSKTKRRSDRTESQNEMGLAAFENASDTDFTLGENRAWLKTHLDELAKAPSTIVRAHIDGRWCDSVQLVDGVDPSVPEHVPYQIALATAADVDRALRTAIENESECAQRPTAEKLEIVFRLAQMIEQKRGPLIAALLMDGGKAVQDADAEISEAIDFCRYYAHQYRRIANQTETILEPRGVTVITPPWNFPFAIPMGGVVAAWVTGNPVILKPATETAFVGQQIVELCHAAGMCPRSVQMVLADDETATPLITDGRTKTVVLTGGTSTAQKFLSLRPNLHLLAETGGKNATIVTHFADRDLAINAIIQSAFGHAGQKCSATSLLILTEAVASDPKFREQLVDAASTMVVGSAWAMASRVTPLIMPPQGALAQGLETLESGESWWLKPEIDRENFRLVSPGIKFGVRPDSFSHRTEFFGPLLSVMVARDLVQAIEWANQTPYGLTAGFHSLDESEQRYFLQHMNAGNLYVNRTTTGAIVQRQPFGGRKMSGFGPGAKAGGPNYLSMFVHRQAVGKPEFQNLQIPVAVQTVIDGFRSVCDDLLPWAESYVAATQELKRVYDPSQIKGQDNLFRYQRHLPVLVLFGPETQTVDCARVLVALSVLGVDYRVTLSSALDETTRLRLMASIQGNRLIGQDHPWFHREERIHLRVLGKCTAEELDHWRPCARCIDGSAVLYGAEELKKYLLEQSISIDYHRYGHLGLRELSDQTIVGRPSPNAPN